MSKDDRKTIFITLSAPAVFRNLFFFPGSVFDKLKDAVKTSNNLRVVIVIPMQFYDKYQPFFSEKLVGLENKIFIESVRLPIKKNIVQKFFYFFYSYLIYTGTTKLLATMGARADEPPAGGKRYLAFLKKLISITFGKSRFIKLKAVPYLFLRIFKERPFSDLFDKYRPDIVFSPHIYDWFEAHFLAEAKRRNIKTIGMPAGWDHLDKYYLPFHVDYLLAQSDQVKDMAIEYQSYAPENIIPVGYSHFDFITEKGYLMPRGEILKSLGFPDNAKIILYISGSAYCPDEPDVIETMLRWADEDKFGFDVRMVIRPYLGPRNRDRAFDSQKFAQFENHPRVVFYKRENWADIEKSIYFINILYHADVVIAVYSTAVLEAAALDRPLIAVVFDGYQMRPYHRSIKRFEHLEHFKDVFKIGALRMARDFNDLFKFLDDYLHNSELDKEKRELLREKVCYKLDGLASQRILDVILKN